jgi:hypothetical protein
MRDSCIFYRSFFEALKDLPPETRANLYDAIFEYSLNGTEIELSGIEVTIFRLVKPQLDANNKRFENGCKPKNKQTGSKTEAKDKQTGSEIEANVNVNENDNENVNPNANENSKTDVRTDNDTKIFIDKVLNRYGISEGQNPRAYMDKYSMISTYMFSELKESEIPEFRKQISFYFNYKDKTGEIKHALPKLIKEGWKEANWGMKVVALDKLPLKPKTNGMPLGMNYQQENYIPGGDAAKLWNK